MGWLSFPAGNDPQHMASLTIGALCFLRINDGPQTRHRMNAISRIDGECWGESVPGLSSYFQVGEESILLLLFLLYQWIGSRGICRKPCSLWLNSVVSCRFSLPPVHWYSGRHDGLSLLPFPTKTSLICRPCLENPAWTCVQACWVITIQDGAPVR